MRSNLIFEFNDICSNDRAYNSYNIVINKDNQMFVFINNTIYKINIKKR